jgi:RNA polymerase sigma factor (sigma-70 family)
VSGFLQATIKIVKIIQGFKSGFVFLRLIFYNTVWTSIVRIYMLLNSLYKNAVNNEDYAEELLFEYLYTRFHLITRQKVLNRQDCEEIVQNALTAILDHYRTIEIKISFASWTQKVLESKLIDYYRSKRVQQNKFTSSSDEEKVGCHLESNPMLESRLLDCLKKINILNKRHARILIMRYQGFNFNEICDRLKITKSNAYSILSRARDMLEKCLKKGDI